MCTYILSKNDPLIIGNQQFSSRLMLGTGKYKNFQAYQNFREKKKYQNFQTYQIIQK